MRLTIVANGDFFSTYGGGQVYVKNLVDELISRQEKDCIDLVIISIADVFSVQPERKMYQNVELYESSPRADLDKLLKAIRPDLVHVHGEKSTFVEICCRLHIPCVVTAHHGGICCPAGALLNSKDNICQVPGRLDSCLPCYLRNIRTGKRWYSIVKHIPIRLYLKIGKALKKLPFIPFLTPIGEAMFAIQEKQSRWIAIKELATHIVAPSDAIANSMILNGCNKDKITVIPHGIPLQQKAPVLPLQTNQSKSVAFYYVGRISYVKGIHVLLKAFSMLQNYDAELHLIGGTGNKDEERYAARLRKQYACDKRIVWHGKVKPERVAELTKGYHCLIHPTICMEIFGLNISEALSMGKYVIATKCGGAEMQIHSEEEGVLVSPNSVMELSEAMLEYIQNPRSTHVAVNSIENHVSELMSLYRRLLPIKA